MAIFHSYVSLPEGIASDIPIYFSFPQRASTSRFFAVAFGRSVAAVGVRSSEGKGGDLPLPTSAVSSESVDKPQDYISHCISLKKLNAHQLFWGNLWPQALHRPKKMLSQCAMCQRMFTPRSLKLKPTNMTNKPPILWKVIYTWNSMSYRYLCWFLADCLSMFEQFPILVVNVNLIYTCFLTWTAKACILVSLPSSFSKPCWSNSTHTHIRIYHYIF